MTESTQRKMIDEFPVAVDTADLIHSIEDETGVLRDELEAERDKYLRLAAEYKNYRRRTEQEHAEAADKGKRDLLLQLVSLADDLDRALASLNESPDAVAEGLGMIHRGFGDILKTNKVIAFESEGEPFDPERHEAFAVVDVGESESGTVHKEMRRGYFLKDRLLRPALVVVTQ